MTLTWPSGLHLITKNKNKTLSSEYDHTEIKTWLLVKNLGRGHVRLSIKEYVRQTCNDLRNTAPSQGV